MAITFLQAKKRQRYLIFILVFIALATLIVVWQGFFQKTEITYTSVSMPQAKEKVIINWQLLSDQKLTELQAFEEILPFEGEIGRDNPFKPY